MSLLNFSFNYISFDGVLVVKKFNGVYDERCPSEPLVAYAEKYMFSTTDTIIVSSCEIFAHITPRSYSR